MFSIKDISIDAKATVGNKLLLTDVTAYYRYNNGAKTDEIEGYKYTVACEDKNYEKIAVKIPGVKQLEKPEKKQYVEFKDLEVYAYFFDGKYNVGARAAAIKEV